MLQLLMFGLVIFFSCIPNILRKPGGNEAELMKLNGDIVVAAAMTQMFFRDEGGCEIGNFIIWLFVKLVCKINIRRSWK